MTETHIADVSDTALWVAAFRALESERPDALFHDPLAAVLTGERGRVIARDMPYPKILAWMMAVRTVAIDRLIFEAIGAGVDTVINIGAGLDTRPYRLDLPKDLQWIEIDFPHMVDMKNIKLSQEVPRCRLSRIGLDVSNRLAAQRLYGEIGSQTRSALVITEGVIPYLSNEHAGQLAEDLRKIPSFRFWIQDYRRSNKVMRQPKKLKKKLKNAPFQFHHPDPLGFFSGFGWKVRTDIKAMDEAERLGRPFPIAFPWTILMRLIPKTRRDAARQVLGYVLFEAV
ncbi:class I SAM-dependent methyltransferase [Oligoflexus tunisiensis]|uniref:class I SAM-dependent methyltransferase n=1 Tax=Oligoflexus tunisiensis TaxID=708132 RepID=UPI000A536E6E|nr:SAM-dependent methyltransferase [Oligoflexus tunisiensis]